MLNYFCFKISDFCLPLFSYSKLKNMAENTNNTNTNTNSNTTTTQAEQTPVTPHTPPVPVAFKEPSGEIRENVNRGETKQVDTRKDIGK